MRLVIVCISFFAIFLSEAQADQAIARRNAFLGITIGEFRSLPYPDTKDNPGAFVACSSDALDTRFEREAVALPLSMRESGIKVCQYFRASYGGSRFETAGVRFGPYSAITKYYFIPDENGYDRLYWVETGSPSEAFNYIIEMHKNKYGEPSERDFTYVQNGFGASFKNDKFTWSVNGDLIIVKRFDDSLERMSISYLKDGLIQKALDALKSNQKKNMGPM